MINIWSSGLYRNHDDHEKWAEHHRLKANHHSIKKFLQDNSIDHRIRSEVGFNVFINDQDAIKYLLDNHGDILNYVSGPVSEEHVEQVQQNNKIEVRRELFFKRYRYRMTYLSTDQFIQTGVQQIADILSDSKAYRWNSNFSQALAISRRADSIPVNTYGRLTRFSRWNRCSIYLENDDDYFQIKLMCNIAPFSEAHAVLIDELDIDK
jgi:hypothetical protein